MAEIFTVLSLSLKVREAQNKKCFLEKLQNRAASAVSKLLQKSFRSSVLKLPRSALEVLLGSSEMKLLKIPSFTCDNLSFADLHLFLVWLK